THASRARSCRLRGRRRALLFKLGHVFLEEHRHPFRGFGAHAQPIFDPLRVEADALVSVFDHGVVSAQFLDDAPVARLPRVDGYNAKIRSVLAPKPFHTDSNCHGSTFLDGTNFPALPTGTVITPVLVWF